MGGRADWRADRHSTMHADNGQMALDLLRKMPTKINLVLLDVVMPVMDGIKLLTVIKVRWVGLFCVLLFVFLLLGQQVLSGEINKITTPEYNILHLLVRLD